MMDKVGQMMLYVSNQDEAAKFWTEKLGFCLISEENYFAVMEKVQ